MLQDLSELPDDYFLIGLREMLSYYSDEESKTSTALMLRILVSFLDEHKLTRKPLLDPRKALPARFTLRKGDLTEEGLQFYRLAEQKWLRGQDREGRAVTDTRALVSTLRTLRRGR